MRSATDDALFLGLVREHRAAHDVADRPHVRQVGLAVVVDRHEAALVDGETRRLRAEPPVNGTRPIDTMRWSYVAVTACRGRRRTRPSRRSRHLARR
jgi:hypothetical protein